MKILRLRLTNLNSLRGDFAIDFSASPLSDAGLFAITGPTGSGKTTILDAITLALYGRVARYGTEPSPEEMMSRHTGSCSAEVEFSCASGTYRSVWQLNRARNKPTGKVQNPERRVISLPDEQVLTQKIDDSNRKVEELTSLNYERFLRSVMLAQGDFAAFLKAKANERTELLEQITGTGIYSDISVAAYRYSDAARSALETLRLQHDAVAVLAPAARAEREKQLADLAAHLVKLKKEISELATRITHAKAFLACMEEASKIEKAAAQIAGQRTLAGVDLGALELHEKAAPFIARLAERDLLAKQQDGDQAKLIERQKALPILTEHSAKRCAEANAAQSSLEGAEAEEESLKPLWAEIGVLDEQIALKRNSATRRAETRQLAEKAQHELQKALTSKLLSLKSHQTTLSDLAEWLQRHAPDAGIAERLPDLQTTFAEWKHNSTQRDDHNQETTALQRAITASEKALAAAEVATISLRKGWETAEAEVQTLRSEWIGLSEHRTLTEWQLDRDAAQTRALLWTDLRTLADEIFLHRAKCLELQDSSTTQAAKKAALESTLGVHQDQLRTAQELATARQKTVDLVRLVQSLEQHRHELVDGQPCPLCGAPDHPYASPESTPSLELNEAVADLRNAVAQLEKLRLEVARIEKETATNATDIVRTTGDLKMNMAQLAEREQRWAEKLKPLGVDLTATQTPEREALTATESEQLAKLKQRVEALRTLDDKVRAAEPLAERAKSQFNEQAAEHDKLGALLKHERETFGKAIERAEASRAAAETSRTHFVNFIVTFSLKAPDLAAGEAALQQLKQRSVAFASKTAERALIEKEAGAEASAIAEVERQVEADTAKIAILREEEDADQRALQALLTNRQARFGGKEISAERERIAERIKACRQQSESAKTAHTKALQEERTCKSDIDGLVQLIVERGAKLSDTTASLTRDANAVGFASVQLLRQAQLRDARVREISAVRTQLDSDEQTLAWRRTENASAQSKEPETAEADARAIDALLEQQTTLDAEREGMEKQRWTFQAELQADEELHKSQSAIGERIEASELEYQRWHRLSALIGSANGTLFAKFAQGLTLERLVTVANLHLAQLNPRYAMRRSSGTPDDLELEIIDHYQGDVTRPMRSLSGGESFLASLALAVGLSELASGKTAIESLFIDEGFGSLDPATLETAMAALEGLRTNGKTIGVISHVEAMQERISTQIQVRKGDGGRSTLEIRS